MLARITSFVHSPAYWRWVAILMGAVMVLGVLDIIALSEIAGYTYLVIGFLALGIQDILKAQQPKSDA